MRIEKGMEGKRVRLHEWNTGEFVQILYVANRRFFGSTELKHDATWLRDLDWELLPDEPIQKLPSEAIQDLYYASTRVSTQLTGAIIAFLDQHADVFKEKRS